jgi:hypothetical protein
MIPTPTVVVEAEMPDHIGRVANALMVGASVEDIHAFLQAEGMSENDIYLTYIAGKMLYESRKALPPLPSQQVQSTCSKVRRIVSTQIG